jgi:prepilin peptidase CpaA
MPADIIFAALLLVLLAAAAFTDLRERRIPNVIPVLVIAIFAVSLFFLPDQRADWMWRFAAFGVALAAGFALFAANVMGGGDVKLFAALALWHPLSDLGMLALLIAIAGAGVALVFAGVDFVKLRGNAGNEASILKDLRQALKARIPYGVGILIGQVWMMALAG